MGVNLPAHLVTINATKAWRGSRSGYQDIEQAKLVRLFVALTCCEAAILMLSCAPQQLQMIGRAGRPGYDTSGTAVIMTDNRSKMMFQELAASCLPAAQSQLLQKLGEMINAEISQRVITSIDFAVTGSKNRCTISSW